jgi:Ala-tRNA(Pro) deacylase
MKCRERMEQYLRENGAGFEVLVHSQAFTMQEVAAALHVPGNQVAKVVIVKADGEMAMLVLPAPYRLNIDMVCTLLGTKKARLAKEKEFPTFSPTAPPGPCRLLAICTVCPSTSTGLWPKHRISSFASAPTARR